MIIVNAMLDCCSMDRGSNLILVLACVGVAGSLMGFAALARRSP